MRRRRWQERPIVGRLQGMQPRHEVHYPAAECLSEAGDDSARRLRRPVLGPDLVDPEHTIPGKDVDEALRARDPNDPARHPTNENRCARDGFDTEGSHTLETEPGEGAAVGGGECGDQPVRLPSRPRPHELAVSRNATAGVGGRGLALILATVTGQQLFESLGQR